MTIHSGHPFLDDQDDPARRFRGRVGGTVSLWTTCAGAGRAGLTMTSYAVALGEPPQVLGLLDPESTLVEVLPDTGTAVVQLLEWRHRDLAEVFAGLLPAPGGPFRGATWEETPWGPVLADCSAWLGVRLRPGGRPLGWSLLVEGDVEHVDLRDSAQPLLHRRGRYVSVDG